MAKVRDCAGRPASKRPAEPAADRREKLRRCGVVKVSPRRLALMKAWAPMEHCEAVHRRLHADVVAALERQRPDWFAGVEDGERPGAIAAANATRDLDAAAAAAAAGAPRVFVTATHATQAGGPRFYASVIDALPDGVSEPPPALRALLPDAPTHLTELGWTVVPPRAAAQEMHADIVANDDGSGVDVRGNEGRFHHVFWKAACGESAPTVTTLVCRGVYGGDGVVRPSPEHYAAERACAGAAALVIDSEVLHRGAASANDGWASTCTAQVCSARGWAALHRHGRCSDGDLARTRMICGAEQAHLELAGYAPLDAGALRESPACRFVERMHDAHHAAVVAALDRYYADDARRLDVPGAEARPGTAAADAVTAAVRVRGLAIFAGPPSQADDEPYPNTGPRFYASVTEAAREHFEGRLPPLAPAIRAAVGDDAPGDETWCRGLGWTLVPPRSTPQVLHADVWTCREPLAKAPPPFFAVMWKRAGSCTTEVVARSAACCGAAHDGHYARLRTVGARAFVFDNSTLHRGAASKGSWSSSFSIEFATDFGRQAWDAYATGGSIKPAGADDQTYWRLLPVAPQPPS
ncbi:hypothetical protein M885DRAFT_551218 [Pelagophyceae sp. CCMP2097]|nr:hypothetical protein M885DRAFT_551218 [Pelagophyceae sp. CCMP2097]